ncbi:protein hunchback [Diachasma alloeum]|uniref:protein hunchback n=1 Tax=Diachasma alloeum TaxID=454923 RepID=UPI0007383D68|nr:protein hunchback [Diachasma alloeum]
MHGSWASAELQQPGLMEDNHSLHSPTPPVWGITDRIAEVSLSDKNNDSGASSGHYTFSGSPKSVRSSFTATSSLSPGSVGSGDSQPMPGCSYDYSPQSGFKSSPSPLDFSRLPGMDDLAGPSGLQQPMDVEGTNAGSDASEGGQENLQCPVCQFAAENRLQLRDHLTGHCTSTDTPDFAHSLFPQLSPSANPQLSPMDDINRASTSSGSGRSEHDSEDIDEPGVRTPRVNSQGKVKTFRCKHCSFLAVTKLAFWEHSRIHIKAERLLTCPRCPFVTEFKHHLEYHIRNHFKSKPFKCDKCSYSCVNKSMLNSHLKSHSNVYQYRCANCSYATKYCHSLKLHLRKYNHQAAMVLNADGTPNPLPIIDVYGTRRGPKRRPVAPKPEAAPVSVPQGPRMLPQLGTLTPMSINNGFNPMLAFNPLNSIFSGLPVVNGFGGGDVEKMEGVKANIFVEYAKAMVADRLNADLPQDGLNYGHSGNGGFGGGDYQFEGAAVANEGEGRNEGNSGFGAPLDLSKPDTSAGNNGNGDAEAQGERIENSPRTGGKSRRKGKAVKLNRQVAEREDEREVVHSGDHAAGVEREETEGSAGSASGGGPCHEFRCQYCEITFGNEVMYTVHMGYHGYSNPFTCNMCGHQCEDKVSFFLHIARVKHA